MAGALTETERDELRALTASFFPDSCRIITVTFTSGGPNAGKSESAPSSPIGCKLRTSNLRPAEMVIASRIESGTVYALDLPYGTAIKAKDVAIVGSRSRRMEVTGIVEGEEEAMVTTAILNERG